MFRHALRLHAALPRLDCVALLLLVALGAAVARPAAAEPAPAGPAGGTGAREVRPEPVNTSLAKALAALTARNWQEAATLLKQLIAAEPDASQWELYQALGTAQTGLREYQDAIQSFEKGAAIARDHHAPGDDPAKLRAGLAQMLTSEGHVYRGGGESGRRERPATHARRRGEQRKGGRFLLCPVL